MDLNSLLTLGRDHLDVVIAAASAIVALIGAFMARNETRKQRRIQMERLRTDIDQASLQWGVSAIDALGRAAAFARTREHHANDSSFNGSKLNMSVAISTLVEQGRLYFPNIDPASKGAEKPGAYRGSRPPILDALMYAYYELQAVTRQGGPTGDNSANFIDECRRLMVSELQAHLDPRRLDEVVERYDDQRAEHRSDAIKRSGNLRASLSARRPELTIDGERKPVTPEPLKAEITL